MKNNSGFTLVELIVVIAIIAILAAIAVPAFVGIIGKSKKGQCEASRTVAKDAYNIYQITDNSFDPENSNSMQFLIDANLLATDIICESGGVLTWKRNNDDDLYISCSIHDDSAIPEGFLFNGTSLFSIDDVLFSDSKNNSWEIKEINDKSVLVNGDKSKSRIFFENDLDSYSLETSARLIDGLGYGVFFESSTDGKGDDTGYILQYDPGKGQGELVIKKRENGKSINSETLLRLKSEDLTSLGLGENWDDDDTTSNWYSEHTINIVVKDLNDGTKTLNAFMDGVQLNENSLLIDANDRGNNNVGYRSWVNNDKSDINISSMSLEDLQ